MAGGCASRFPTLASIILHYCIVCVDGIAENDLFSNAWTSQKSWALDGTSAIEPVHPNIQSHAFSQLSCPCSVFACFFINPIASYPSLPAVAQQTGTLIVERNSWTNLGMLTNGDFHVDGLPIRQILAKPRKP